MEMEINEFKKVGIKIRMCYFFDDIIEIQNFDFDNNILDEKCEGNNLMYDVLYKTMIGAKPLDIMFDKVNGFITDYDEVKYLILFVLGKYDAFFDRIIYKNKTKKSVFFLIIMSKLTLIMIFF